MRGALRYFTPPFWGLLAHNRLEQLQKDVAFTDAAGSKWSFKSHYQEHVWPHVQTFEDKRCTALRRFRERMFFVIPACVALIAFIAWWAYSSSTFDDAHFMVLIGGLLLLHWWGTRPVRDYKLHVKKHVFPHIFSYFGEAFKYNATCSVRIADLEPSGLIPHYTSSSKEDHIKGEYKGVGLELFEATLKRRQGSGKNRRTVTVFQGMFLTLSMHKNFKGQTIVQKDKNEFWTWLDSKIDKNKLQPVTLEDPEFEKQFDVKSTDQVEARYLLTTSFMERLNKLSQLFDGSQIECSFYDKKVLFKVTSSKNRFEVQDIYKPATFEDDIHHILEEMGIIFDMIEHLKLHEETRL